jgi:hypothetical protein
MPWYQGVWTSLGVQSHWMKQTHRFQLYLNDIPLLINCPVFFSSTFVSHYEWPCVWLVQYKINIPCLTLQLNTSLPIVHFRLYSFPWHTVYQNWKFEWKKRGWDSGSNPHFLL